MAHTSQPDYVLLTGTKANAGDYEIHARMAALLEAHRPERRFIAYPNYQPLTDERLEIVNGARALILAGGPGYQPSMHPRVYPLRPRIDEIRVPIIGYGLGWKALPGRPADVPAFRFKPQAAALVRRIEASGFLSSCRDSLTHQMLALNGCTKQLMTGCPVWFSLEHLGKPLEVRPVQRVSFAPGAVMIESRAMLEQSRRILSMLHDLFGAKLVVAFHHPVDRDAFRRAYPERGADAVARYFRAHDALIAHADALGAPWQDVSQAAENLEAFYDGVDLAIGFRVHAHLYMLSRRKPSVLLIEDGRGYGVQASLGGVCIDTVRACPNDLMTRALFKLKWAERVRPVEEAPAQLRTALEHELAHGFPRLQGIPATIDAHYPVMKAFLEQLP